jgi:hypothetical protein
MTSAILSRKGFDSSSSVCSRSHEQQGPCHTRDQKFTTFPFPWVLLSVNTAFPFTAFERFPVLLYNFVFKSTYLIVISGKVHMSESLMSIISHQSHLFIRISWNDILSPELTQLGTWAEQQQEATSTLEFILPLNSWNHCFSQSNSLKICGVFHEFHGGLCQ